MINKDLDQVMSESVQVQKFLEQLKPEHPELQSAKMMIRQNYATNFVGACAFFSSIVSSVYGAAQIKYRCNRLQKRKISSVHCGSQDRGRRGRGCFGRHGRGGRVRHGSCGGHGGRSGRHSNYVNGINVSDPNRSFSPNEWNRLGREGRDCVINEQNRSAGCGGTGNNNRNVGTTSSLGGNRDNDNNNNGENEGQGASSDCGSNNGRGFGCGAYGDRLLLLTARAISNGNLVCVDVAGTAHLTS